MGKLTAAQVKHARPGRHGDGRGLYLQVIGGSKTWVLRYEHNKRERWMGLGSAEFVSLAQARERAFELRRQLKDRGIDPLERRRAAADGARLAALKHGTFEEVARQYIEVRSAQWKGDGSRREWLSTLQRYAFPIIGSFSVASIDTALVHRVLEPVWTKTPHVGQRLRERIEAVLEFAKSMGLRDGENPARWKRHLANVLPKASRTGRTNHHPALPFNQMPEFMAELRALPGIAARALEFTILTAARTGEARFARWFEFDLDGRAWAIPGERMKGDKEHRVPLSDRALAILRELPPEAEADAVFPGRSAGGFLNQDAMADVLAKLRPDATVHGFRSTFRDWAAETTGYPNHVVEMALAHAIPNGVEAAYRRGDLLEKRRRLMEEWSRFCSWPVAPEATLTRLRGPASTPEAQIKAAIKLLKPAPDERAFCERWVRNALAAVDAEKRQTQHEKDVASKQARKALETYRAALKRAQIASEKLPKGMRKKLGLLADLEYTALPNYAALIAVCDRALPLQLPFRGEFDRYSSATWAWNVLAAMGEQPTATRGGKWAKLAAILYGSKDDDFFHYCRMCNATTRASLDQTAE